MSMKTPMLSFLNNEMNDPLGPSRWFRVVYKDIEQIRKASVQDPEGWEVGFEHMSLDYANEDLLASTTAGMREELRKDPNMVFVQFCVNIGKMLCAFSGAVFRPDSL